MLCLVLIIIPLSYILYNCVVEATLLYQRLHSDQNSFVGYIDRIKDSYPFLQDWLHYAGYDLERIKSLLTKAALSASSFLARNTVTLGENTLGFLTNLALASSTSPSSCSWTAPRYRNSSSRPCPSGITAKSCFSASSPKSRGQR
ncbi:MAG: hypothetical protein ACLR7Z_04370 [Bilophila wadsworthia]